MKFEFGDLYRFIVSLGVVLISISILVPWLFLKEPFDLFKSQDDLAMVTTIAHDAILSRQATVSFVIKFIPWFSSIGCICGMFFIFIGLKKWHTNQLLLDEQTKIEVELKKQSLRDATRDEVEFAQGSELYEQAINENKTSDQLSSLKMSYAKVEQIVINRLKQLYPQKYQVETEKMVGGIVIDILLQGKHVFTKDFIIEVKLIRKGFNYGWLRESFLKNIYAKNIYAQLTNRVPNTLLLILTEFKDAPSEKYDTLLTKIYDDRLGRKGKDRVVLIDKNKFQELSSEQLQETIGIYA